MPRIRSRTIGGALVVMAFSWFLAPSTSDAQKRNVITITVDKSRPVKQPGKERTVPTTKSQQPKAANTTQSPSPELSCLGLLLILDDIQQVQIVAFNGPHNTTVNFTTGQSNPGTLGLSLSFAGPFVESITVPVPLDGNGNGASEIFYVEGLQLGISTLYANSVEMGNTTVFDFTVLPQCNCPPIPIIP